MNLVTSLALSVAMLTSVAGAQQQGLPASLRQALQGLPGTSVLDAPVDPKSLADLKQGGFWPPWSMADLDGDGTPDAVAVVVKGQGANRTYGVIVLHTRTPGMIQWVVPMGKESITGLTTKQLPNSVVPLFCFYCDSNTFFRWSGNAYEMELRTVGEEVTLRPEEGHPLGVFSDASRDSKMVARFEPCTKAKISARSGTSAATRWYLVETDAPKKVRGWVPRSFVLSFTELGVCG